MLTIAAISQDGAIRPAQAIPEGAVRVICDGVKYTVYQAGDTLPVPAPVSTVPGEVTMRQAQLAMLAFTFQDGSILLDKVNAAIAQQPRAAQVTWNASSTVMRANPLIAALQPVLGLTSAQVDQLFTAAATL